MTKKKIDARNRKHRPSKKATSVASRSLNKKPASRQKSADIIWTSTLDDRYIIAVRRLAEYRGELTIHDGDKLLHREEVGLAYAKGLTKQSAEELVTLRQEDGDFRSAEELALRVPTLNRRELTRVAQIGALNRLDRIRHRRDALWQVERAGKLEGPLFRQSSDSLREDSELLPLEQMNIEERLIADYTGTGLTVGKHPMYYRRAELGRSNILSAQDLRQRRDGECVRVAGCIIARQRPGTAKGFIFISMEDETGIANVIVTPDLYERDRLVVTRSKFLLVEGPLQNQGNVIHVKAKRLTALSNHALEVRSQDFH